jgi:KaiC/GvpD/RAD55 family RecA-like ATPase
MERYCQRSTAVCEDEAKFAGANHADDQTSTMHSGIAPLDELLGGLVPGRLHLLTGGPGTGKSTACLQFLNAGLVNNEAVALLTLDRAADLASHALSIGLDVEARMRTGRMLIARFRTGFTNLLESSLPDDLINDVGRLFVGVHPVRLVIDPITPFFADRSAAGSALIALARLLEELAITTIVTYPGDVSESYDPRVDPIVQRAASIIHLTRMEDGNHRMQVVQARSQAAPMAPIGFVLKPGVGAALPEPVSKPKRARSRVVQEKSAS